MTEADLLKALTEARAVRPGDDPGYTPSELAIRVHGRDTSHTRKMVTDALKRLKSEGRLVVGRRRIECLNGNMYPVSVYGVAPKKAKR